MTRTIMLQSTCLHSLSVGILGVRLPVGWVHPRFCSAVWHVARPSKRTTVLKDTYMTTALTLPTTIDNSRAVAILSKKGKEVGTRITFGGGNRATDIKAALKAANPKWTAGELSKQTNLVLTGKVTLAWAEHDAMNSAMRSAGYQPDYQDIRKNTATVRYIKPVDAKPATLAEKVAHMSEVELNELRALLFAGLAPAGTDAK